MNLKTNHILDECEFLKKKKERKKAEAQVWRQDRKWTISKKKFNALMMMMLWRRLKLPLMI